MKHLRCVVPVRHCHDLVADRALERNWEYSEVPREKSTGHNEEGREQCEGYIAYEACGPARLSSRRLALLRYSVAVACVAVGVLLALWLQPVLDPETLLLVAVLLAAWFGGFRPALLASLLATLAVALLLHASDP